MITTSSTLRAFVALLVASQVCIVTRAQTLVSLSFGAGQLSNANGVAPADALVDGRLVALVADTLGNGFGAVQEGRSLSLGSFLNADDMLLLVAFVDSGSFGPGGVALPATQIDLSSPPYLTVSPNDALALLWFPTLTSGSTTVPLATDYGLFTGGLTPDSGSPWVVPSGGGLNDLFFATQSAGGTYADVLGKATLHAVPEPATFAAIAGALTLGLAFARRRRPVA